MRRERAPALRLCVFSVSHVGATAESPLRRRRVRGALCVRVVVGADPYRFRWDLSLSANAFLSEGGKDARAETRKTKKARDACTSKHSRALGQKKIPPSRVHPKRKPCIARRYPRLCFALPTSAAVEPRGRPAYPQSNIGFHLKVVGSDMVVYHKLSRINQSKTEVFDCCKGVQLLREPSVRRVFVFVG